MLQKLIDLNRGDRFVLPYSGLTGTLVAKPTPGAAQVRFDGTVTREFTDGYTGSTVTIKTANRIELISSGTEVEVLTQEPAEPAKESAA